MNKKFSMHFSKKKLLGEKSVYIDVLHHLSKFEEHRFTSKKILKKNSRSRMGPFNHSNMLLLTPHLKMDELSVFQCPRRTSVSVY